MQNPFFLSMVERSLWMGHERPRLFGNTSILEDTLLQISLDRGHLNRGECVQIVR